MKEQEHSPKSSMAGGLFMLAGLVVMLTVPMAIGYFTITVKPAPTLHASAE